MAKNSLRIQTDPTIADHDAARRAAVTGHRYVIAETSKPVTNLQAHSSTSVSASGNLSNTSTFAI